MNKKYLFTIVVPIYNSELWIEETIQSIVGQSIGIKNIQLILIDDGSTDKSKQICEMYQERYKENIEFMSKSNSGVSSTRNYAIPHIKGEYVEFLDSDDFISIDTLEKVYDFFKKHKQEIDIVSIPMYYFEGRTGGHYLNTKFDRGSRIVDLKENFRDIFVHTNSIFIKSDLVKKYRFDESLVSCEDGKMAIQLLLERQKYGVIDNCQYNYRLRKKEKNSLSQTAKKDKNWYIKQLIHYPLWAYEYCKRKIGYVPDFVKYMLASHLQWRFKEDLNNNSILSANENKKYNNLLKLSIKQIDDYIIDALTQVSDEQKEYIKSFKKQEKSIDDDDWEER